MKFKLLTLAFILFIIPGQAFAQTFTDDSGQEITVLKPFTRIISLYGAHTENLFSLGLDKEIIAVSKKEVFPPSVMGKPRISYRDDVERFLALKPDLVIVRPMIFRGYIKLIKKLNSLGIVVVSLQPTSVEKMYNYWLKLGILTGRKTEAEKMIANFQEGLALLKSKTADIPEDKRRRVYFESMHRKMKTFTPTSMAMFTLESAGGINVAPDAKSARGSNIAHYGKERILARAHEIDFFLAQLGTMNQVTLKAILAEPGFMAIKAIKNNQVALIAEQIVSRPTPRLLEGIFEVGRTLYPDRFNDTSRIANKETITRADLAELIINALNIPLITPESGPIKIRHGDIQHRFGEFQDVDYSAPSYKFIETVVLKGLFKLNDPRRFKPDRACTSRELSFALSSFFKKADITFNTSDLPVKLTVSGREALNAIQKMSRSKAGSK